MKIIMTILIIYIIIGLIIFLVTGDLKRGAFWILALFEDLDFSDSDDDTDWD